MATPISEEIESLVQAELGDHPDLADRKIDFSTAADESLVIWLDGVAYHDVADIPDDRIRHAVQKSGGFVQQDGVGLGALGVSDPKLSLAGLFPPVPTAFDSQGDLQLDAFQTNLKRWNAEPLDGYVVGGSNGEFVFLTPDERLAVVGAARQVIPQERLLIGGAGAESNAWVARLVRSHGRNRRRRAASRDAQLLQSPDDG